MKVLRALSLTCAVLLAWLGVASAQPAWYPLATQPTFFPSQVFLLTDGRVMVQAYESSNWYALTPDINGSYLNGTWSQLASTDANYAPLFYASAILPDGRLIIQGGEYNISGPAVFTTKGAVYDPYTNKWSAHSAPKGWKIVGDAQSVVLADGKFLMASCCDDPSTAAFLEGATDKWTATGTGKADSYDEEAFTLLPGGKVLTVDTTIHKGSEIYDPTTGAWSSAGSLPVDVAEYVGDEIGPAVLRPDGTVIQFGATAHNAVYDTNTGTWSAAPDFPLNGSMQQLDVYDGPAALLPNGNVLVMTSPGQYMKGAQFFEWDGTNFNTEANTPNAANASSYFGRLLVLPTGGVLQTDYSKDIEIYFSTGDPDPSWEPVITEFKAKLHPGHTETLRGTQLTGLSEGGAFGDDFQDATNYPLVRIINVSTSHVFYCRTHKFSSGVATGSTIQSTDFDIPAGVETGPSYLQVVTNGIASNSVDVTVE